MNLGTSNQAHDANVEAEAERVQHLRHHLDMSRELVLTELQKGAARDKELVQSLERHIQGVETELQGILQSQAGLEIAQAITEQGEEVVSAINEHLIIGGQLVSAINDTLVSALHRLGEELIHHLPG